MHSTSLCVAVFVRCCALLCTALCNVVCSCACVPVLSGAFLWLPACQQIGPGISVGIHPPRTPREGQGIGQGIHPARAPKRSGNLSRNMPCQGSRGVREFVKESPLPGLPGGQGIGRGIRPARAPGGQGIRRGIRSAMALGGSGNRSRNPPCQGSRGVRESVKESALPVLPRGQGIGQGIYLGRPVQGSRKSSGEIPS